MFNPNEDGLTHINVYSKGKTDIGKWLSNFSYSPIETVDGSFNSIEGYWYWLSCKDDSLRKLHGWKAKSVGRSLGGEDWVFDDDFRLKIKKALQIKLESYPKKYKELKQTTLPLVHYYNFYGRIIVPNGCEWIIQYLEVLRRNK